MKVEFLGTGTSQGVPVIGCTCPVCRSTDPRDRRLRTSAFISVGDIHLVIDAGPDFRQQMLRSGIDRIEALLITHQHNDHIIGLDDVRPFNFMYGKDIPVYGSAPVLQELRQRFAYIFSANPYPGAPRLAMVEIDKDHPFDVEGTFITPVEVLHGAMPVLGFRFGDFCYITDAKTISASEREKLTGLKVLVLNALRHKKHHSHLNIREALALIHEIGPEMTYLTHISHNMGLHRVVEKELPSYVRLAYDGLRLGIDSPPDGS